MRIFCTNDDKLLQFEKKGFNIVNCGYDMSISKFVWHLERTRPDYYLLYITQGAVRYILEGKTIKVEQGEFFMYSPYDKQNFTFDTYTHTITHWVHFVGDEADALISKLGLFHGKIYPSSDREKELLLSIINEQTLRQKNYDVLSKAMLIELLTLLARNNSSAKGKSPQAKDTDLFLSVVDRIAKNPKISNQECAELCCLSVSQFLRIFKKKFDITPHQYKLNILINVAKDLLAHGTMSVTEIADNLGFDLDNLYFNSLFKKQTGLSPTEYRKKYGGDTIALNVSNNTYYK